jgi:hypothetical protein
MPAARGTPEYEDLLRDNLAELKTRAIRELANLSPAWPQRWGVLKYLLRHDARQLHKLFVQILTDAGDRPCKGPLTRVRLPLLAEWEALQPPEGDFPPPVWTMLAPQDARELEEFLHSGLSKKTLGVVLYQALFVPAAAPTATNVLKASKTDADLVGAFCRVVNGVRPADQFRALTPLVAGDGPPDDSFLERLLDAGLRPDDHTLKRLLNQVGDPPPTSGKRARVVLWATGLLLLVVFLGGVGLYSWMPPGGTESAAGESDRKLPETEAKGQEDPGSKKQGKEPVRSAAAAGKAPAADAPGEPIPLTQMPRRVHDASAYHGPAALQLLGMIWDDLNTLKTTARPFLESNPPLAEELDKGLQVVGGQLDGLGKRIDQGMTQPEGERCVLAALEETVRVGNDLLRARRRLYALGNAGLPVPEKARKAIADFLRREWAYCYDKPPDYQGVVKEFLLRLGDYEAKAKCGTLFFGLDTCLSGFGAWKFPSKEDRAQKNEKLNEKMKELGRLLIDYVVDQETGNPAEGPPAKGAISKNRKRLAAFLARAKDSMLAGREESAKFSLQTSIGRFLRESEEGATPADKAPDPPKRPALHTADGPAPGPPSVRRALAELIRQSKKDLEQMADELKPAFQRPGLAEQKDQLARQLAALDQLASALGAEPAPGPGGHAGMVNAVKRLEPICLATRELRGALFAKCAAPFPEGEKEAIARFLNALLRQYRQRLDPAPAGGDSWSTTQAITLAERATHQFLARLVLREARAKAGLPEHKSETARKNDLATLASVLEPFATGALPGKPSEAKAVMPAVADAVVDYVAEEAARTAKKDDGNERERRRRLANLLGKLPPAYFGATWTKRYADCKSLIAHLEKGP